MINLFWSGLLTMLLLSGCGSNGTPTRHNDFIPLTSIEIVAESPAIEVSKTIAALTSTKLKVTGNYSNLFTRDITDQVVWSSNTPAVAEFITPVNPNRVTGHVPGSAALIATVGGVSGSYVLTVSSATVSSMTVTPATASAPTVPKGRTKQFSVSGLFSDNTTQDLTFDAAWTSDAIASVTVSDVTDSKGLATGVGIGSANIKATFNTQSDSSHLTVTEAVVQSITISPANPSVLSLSTTGNFTATGIYSDGTINNITDQVSWSSFRSDIATIPPTAAITGVPATTKLQGTTLISATPLSSLPSDPGISGTTNLKVTGGNLSRIEMSTANISPANGIMTLVKGTVARITATGFFSNGASRDITGVVAWATADSNLATITQPGGNLAWLNAIAETPGTTISFDNLPTTPNLIITALVPQSLVITPTTQNLIAGISTRYTAIATFSDGSTKDVTSSSTWISDGPAIAEVDNTTELIKGRVRGVSAGTTTIRATYGDVSVAAPSVAVTVTAPILQTPVISIPSTVPPGMQVKITATANGQNVTEDTVWEWETNKPFVVIFADSSSQPGQVVGVDSGTATLKATFGGKTATATVTVP